MKIIAKTYSCNYETYKLIYKDAIKKAYLMNKKDVSVESIQLETIQLEGENIYGQRSNVNHSRTISVYEDEKLKFIIGFSNTNFDEDKKKEVEIYGGKYVYGKPDYHSNTYLFQGINKIFEYYFDMKQNDNNIKLYFYLLDTDQSYAKNLSNLMNYRKLATIGFDILNLNEISFEEFEKLGFSTQEHHEDIKYISFNKFANDILFLSKKNTGNLPSYLKCVDENYDISKETDNESDDKFRDLSKQKYIYTFKVLSAEGYDSLLTMWTLLVLAKNENKKLEFLFASEKYNFRLGQDDIKNTTDFTEPIKRLITKANLNIEYESTEEVRQQFERENNQYEIAKQKGILRNQELFKNNMRKKGIQTKCYLCGCEVEEILEAAHLWPVSAIKKCPNAVINDLINNTSLKNIIPDDCNERFYKKYLLANSGDNGIWLCSNHHGLFDNNYYCFDSNDGKILVDLNAKEECKAFFQLTITLDHIPDEVLSEETKVFLEKREELFKEKVSDYAKIKWEVVENE